MKSFRLFIFSLTVLLLFCLSPQITKAENTSVNPLGQTIFIRGWYYDNWNAGIFSFNKSGNKLSIVAEEGNPPGLDKSTHDNYANNIYYKIDISTHKSIKKSLTVYGRTKKGDAIKSWNNKDTSVEAGDIVSVYALEPSKNFIKDSKGNKVATAERPTIYYKVTNTGLELIPIDEFNYKSLDTPIYSSVDSIKERLENIFPNLNVNANITSKVDTTNSGEQMVDVSYTIENSTKINGKLKLTVNPGTIVLNVPHFMEFNDYKIGDSNRIIGLKNNPNIYITDNRGSSNNQGFWRLTAQATESNPLAQNMFYKTANSKQSLSNEVLISNSDVQNNATSPTVKNISNDWNNEYGFFVEIPPDRSFYAQDYSTTIIWNLASTP